MHYGALWKAERQHNITHLMTGGRLGQG